MERNTSKKRGPKPQGERPMTAAERQRKRRDAIRDAGGRTFLMDISSKDIKWLEFEAQQTGRSITEILKEVLGLSLHRYGQFFERSMELARLGVSAEMLELFERLHAFPKVPSIEELFEMVQKTGNEAQVQGDMGE